MVKEFVAISTDLDTQRVLSVTKHRVEYSDKDDLEVQLGDIAYMNLNVETQIVALEEVPLLIEELKNISKKIVAN